MVSPTPLFDQATAEAEMVASGRSRYWAQISNAKQSEAESRTRYGQVLLSGAVVPCADGIREWLENARGKGAGRKHGAFPFLDKMPTDVVAFLTAQSVIDCIGLNKSYASTVSRIGQAIEDEARFRWLKDEVPGLWRKLDKQLATKGSYQHKRTVIMLAMSRAGLNYPQWSDASKATVGAVLLDIFISRTALCAYQTIRIGRVEQKRVVATDKTIEWIRSFNDRCEELSPVFLPSVEPPPEWTSPYFGGYKHNSMLEVSMVKRASKARLDRLAKAEMPSVYATLNALQNTPWRINKRVLEVLDALKDSPTPVGALPSAQPEPLPPKPVDIATNAEARRAWRTAASAVHERNAATNSLRVASSKMRWVAHRYAAHDRIYFPYQLDFRGRIYALPNYLNPQGSDLAKSLLEFADGVGCLDEADVEWLKITGANLYGVDKVSFEERKAWVDAHREHILRVADDPVGYTWWQEADGGDSAWCFLAWCFEWAGWLRTGRGFVTRLPCAIDGTNNGLQILALLTRDEVAAKATNVVPSSVPQDIYRDVADGALRIMQRVAEQPDEVPPPRIAWSRVAEEINEDETLGGPYKEAQLEAFYEGGEKAPASLSRALKAAVAKHHYTPEPQQRMARYWLSWGIDRKTTKRPVMVLPYGGTFASCQDYLMSWYRESAAKRGVEVPKTRETFDRVRFLATVVWQAIDYCVQRPRRCMEWLQQVASLFNQENKAITWTTPVGFPVEQKYAEVELKRITTTLGEGVSVSSKVKLNIAVQNPRKLDKRRQRNGISPNYVHSLDGAALCQTVANALRAGVTSFSMIHDSYGTHSPRMHQLAAACRHAFVELFTPDLLNRLREEVIAALPEGTEVPPVPEFGNLDVSQVRDSEFFFA